MWPSVTMSAMFGGHSRVTARPTSARGTKVGGRSAPPRRGALAVGITLAVFLASCGSEDEHKEAAGGTDPTNTASAEKLNAEWPLTGEPLEGDLPEHPVYVVKVDNTAGSEPQVGLDSADLVAEQLVEGGLSRLAVFYYQEIPQRVGPVRSLRDSDIGIAKPVAGTLVASGGTERTEAKVTGAEVAIATEDSSTFVRDDNRSAPYNLFAELAKAAEAPAKEWGAPQRSYFKFGQAKDFEGDIAVSTVVATFSGSHSTRWEYTGGGWTRQGSYAEEGADFAPDNLLLLRVKTRDAGYQDSAGSQVPETVLAGTGEAVLVHGERAARLTWDKPLRSSMLRLSTRNGDPVPVPAGRTWIELVPAEGGDISLAR